MSVIAASDCDGTKIGDGLSRKNSVVEHAKYNSRKVIAFESKCQMNVIW